MGQVMISLTPTYGKLIMSGTKTVELRNRIVRIEPLTTVWMYVKLPVGKVVAHVDVEQVIHDRPFAIWRSYERRMCIERTQFERYVGDRVQVSAIVLQRPVKVDEPLSIAGIRSRLRGFQPPQFYYRIEPESVLFSMLASLRQDCASGDVV